MLLTDMLCLTHKISDRLNNGAGSVDLLAPYTGQSATASQQPAQPKAPDFSAWRRTAAPKMIAAFIKAGKPEAARATMDFMRGEEGQLYSSEWLKGMTAYEAGDYDAAIPHLTSLYNTRRPDGRRIQIKASGNGEYDVDHLDENTGGIAATHRIGGKDLATFALNTMSPQQQIKWHLDRQGENAKFSRELSLLDRRSQYQDAREADREDRRDQRLNTRFEQQNELLDRKLEEGGGLTLAQRRGNLEIDAARQQLEGVSPTELKKRTQPYTATGRENPDFDPQLASRAKLAGRRKIGDDPVFDQRLSAQPAQPAPQPPTVQSRFTADPAMKGYRLGNQTSKGFEVFDANGKLLGHYR